jgi:SNF2 family DNA or RNA helicase
LRRGTRRRFSADEAHYLKNPAAKRTQASLEIMERSDYRVLMTGTPIENKLEEMVRLVEAVNLDVARAVRVRGADVDEQITATEFTELVSPAYLRRKTIDVLRELPERIEVEEWVELNEADLQAYIAAVQERSYPGMRRAVTLGNKRTSSGKLERLDELIAEYRDAGRKVVIFSFFINLVAALVRLVVDLLEELPPDALLFRRRDRRQLSRTPP